MIRISVIDAAWTDWYEDMSCNDFENIIVSTFIRFIVVRCPEVLSRV